MPSVVLLPDLKPFWKSNNRLLYHSLIRLIITIVSMYCDKSLDYSNNQQDFCHFCVQDFCHFCTLRCNLNCTVVFWFFLAALFFQMLVR